VLIAVLNSRLQGSEPLRVAFSKESYLNTSASVPMVRQLPVINRVLAGLSRQEAALSLRQFSFW
jgi:hypothetical protein